MTTLVTGASGFVGSALSARLSTDFGPVRCAFRSKRQSTNDFEAVSVGDVSGDTDWSTSLVNVSQVVHLVARTHTPEDSGCNSIAEFQKINVESTRNLALQAAESGVKRFIFLSSVKVNGEYTQLGHPFTSSDVSAPDSHYGRSKYEAELLLREISEKSGMEIVIIRSPLIYGPGVKGNFELLIRLLRSGIPLPFAALVNNRRSFVSLDNLIDFILTCLKHPLAANRIFLVSDGEDLSTADLLRRLGVAIGRPARLFYVPVGFLKLSAAALGKHGIYNRLCESLQVDISNTEQVLGWSPAQSVDEGLRQVLTRASV